eukprot:g341.t1
MRLFLRDDLLSWHASKTRPRSQSQQTRIETQLQDRVKANTAHIMAILKTGKGRVSSRDKLEKGSEGGMSRRTKSKERVDDIDKDRWIQQLIDKATNPVNLARMSPTWNPTL